MAKRDDDRPEISATAWNRAIVACPMSTSTKLCALIMSHHSTWSTGRNITLSEMMLMRLVGVSTQRAIRYLIAELRDEWDVINQVRRGNQYRPTEHRLVLPSDLAERAARLFQPPEHRKHISGAAPETHFRCTECTGNLETEHRKYSDRAQETHFRSSSYIPRANSYDLNNPREIVTARNARAGAHASGQPQDRFSSGGNGATAADAARAIGPQLLTGDPPQFCPRCQETPDYCECPK